MAIPEDERSSGPQSGVPFDARHKATALRLAAHKVATDPEDTRVLWVFLVAATEHGATLDEIATATGLDRSSVDAILEWRGHHRVS